MKSEIAVSMQAAKLMLVFTLLLGGGYTLIMTGLAQLFFPRRLQAVCIGQRIILSFMVRG